MEGEGRNEGDPAGSGRRGRRRKEGMKSQRGTGRGKIGTKNEGGTGTRKKIVPALHAADNVPVKPEAQAGVHVKPSEAGITQSPSTALGTEGREEQTTGGTGTQEPMLEA
jgi:hypothetical protein